MKTYLQTKFKYFLLLGIFILPSTSFAITSDLTSPQPTGTYYTVTCTQLYVVYDPVTLDKITDGSCSPAPFTSQTNSSLIYAEFTDIFGAPYENLAIDRLKSQYVGEINIQWTTPIPYNPSLFGTLLTNPTSLYNDFAEVTRQHMWGGVFGWIILSLGIYTAFWLAMALIGLLGTAFRNDRERTARINRLADNALAEYEAFDRKHRKG
jgi:hypothetical protein